MLTECQPYLCLGRQLMSQLICVMPGFEHTAKKHVWYYFAYQGGLRTHLSKSHDIPHVSLRVFLYFFPHITSPPAPLFNQHPFLTNKEKLFIQSYVP